MPKNTAKALRSPSFRLVGNLAVLALLILAADWLYGWWRNGHGFVCNLVPGFNFDPYLKAIGLFGLVLAMLGVTLGGVRHPMTGIGIAVMVLGLLGMSLLGEFTTYACS